MKRLVILMYIGILETRLHTIKGLVKFKNKLFYMLYHWRPQGKCNDLKASFRKRRIG